MSIFVFVNIRAILLYLRTKLLKPRKSYEETVRSILSVAHFLNYAFVNPGVPEKAAWDHVKELFP
jgi:hypothetical protein